MAWQLLLHAERLAHIIQSTSTGFLHFFFLPAAPRARADAELQARATLLVDKMVTAAMFLTSFSSKKEVEL